MTPPLGEVAELNEPQLPDGAQLQLTPLLAESLATVAAIGTVVPPIIDAGGLVVHAIVMGLLEPHATKAAVMAELRRERSNLRNMVLRDVIEHLRSAQQGLGTVACVG
jgi:hypothetical protein